MLKKNMTRKIAVLFTLSLVISFFLMLGFLGKQGFLNNMYLKQELEGVRYKKDVLSLQVDSLKSQQSELLSGEGLKDAAFKLGYQSEGEQVYYFSDEIPSSGNTAKSVSPESPRKKPFTGIPVFWVFLLALAFSFVLTVSYYFVANRRIYNNDEQ
jgi:cell division protein FtsB